MGCKGKNNFLFNKFINNKFQNIGLLMVSVGKLPIGRGKNIFMGFKCKKFLVPYI